MDKEKHIIMTRSIARYPGFVNNQKGVALATVLILILLMSSVMVLFTAVLYRNIELIEHAKLNTQARNMAEAGVYHAIAKLRNGENMVDFNGSLDTGSYAVTYTTVSGRTLIQSVGTVSGVSETAGVEIEYTLPTALTKLFSAANNVKARAASKSATVTITGDLHANSNLELKALNNGILSITGAVSATGQVLEGSKHNQSDSRDTKVYINTFNNDSAPVTEGAALVTFPGWDYDFYKDEADAAGAYYSSGQTFANQTISPSCGFIYVDGNVTINGTVVLNGGIICDDLTIHGALEQNVTAHDRNFIIASVQDVSIHGRLETGECLVYAKRDIATRAAGTEVNVTGLLTAQRDLSFWNVQTNVVYNYLMTYPDAGMTTEADELVIVVSWTQ